MAIIGAILGDICGSRWEFGRPHDLDWKNVDLFDETCCYTDDTVLTVATKFAIQNELQFGSTYKEFARYYDDCGYGETFREWVWSFSYDPYGSFGNGSAMRVSPVIDIAKNEVDLLKLAIDSARCTHNHTEGMKGAYVTALCGYMAKQGASKSEIESVAAKFYPAEDYRFSVKASMTELRKDYIWDVTCQGSVPVAIRCFLDSENYEEFLRNVLSLNCDTDTLAAIGGGIAEEFYHGTGFNNEYLLNKYLDDNLYEIVMGN